MQWYNNVYKYLQNKGFERYEVSNFCQNGFECKHNLGYWNLKQYYGFGVSAHSYIDGYRKSNTSNINKYLDGDYGQTKEKLSLSEFIEEKLMLGLRLADGVNIQQLKQLGFDILREKKHEIDVLKKQGVVEIDENIRINPEFFGVGDSITLKLLP